MEIKNDRSKIVKILIFRSLSREHFQSTLNPSSHWKVSIFKNENFTYDRCVLYTKAR